MKEADELHELNQQIDGYAKDMEERLKKEAENKCAEMSAVLESEIQELRATLPKRNQQLRKLGLPEIDVESRIQKVDGMATLPRKRPLSDVPSPGMSGGPLPSSGSIVRSFDASIEKLLQQLEKAGEFNQQWKTRYKQLESQHREMQLANRTHNDAMQEELRTARTKIAQMTRDASHLESQLAELKQEASYRAAQAQPAAYQTPPRRASTSGGQVFVTPHGGCYHTQDCGHVNLDTATSMPKNQAKRDPCLRACTSCDPLHNV